MEPIRVPWRRVIAMWHLAFVLGSSGGTEPVKAVCGIKVTVTWCVGAGAASGHLSNLEKRP